MNSFNLSSFLITIIVSSTSSFASDADSPNNLRRSIDLKRSQPVQLGIDEARQGRRPTPRYEFGNENTVPEEIEEFSSSSASEKLRKPIEDPAVFAVRQFNNECKRLLAFYSDDELETQLRIEILKVDLNIAISRKQQRPAPLPKEAGNPSHFLSDAREVIEFISNEKAIIRPTMNSSRAGGDPSSHHPLYIYAKAAYSVAPYLGQKFKVVYGESQRQ